MKIKIFELLAKFSEEMENEMNAWFSSNHITEIVDIKATSTLTRDGSILQTVYIFYK